MLIEVTIELLDLKIHSQCIIATLPELGLRKDKIKFNFFSTAKNENVVSAGFYLPELRTSKFKSQLT